MNTPRQIKMVGFLQAQNCSIAPGSWRHPAGMTDFTTPEYFQRLGRVLEEGKFHLAFFDDRLAMPDIFRDDYRDAVANGVRVVKMDPATIIAVIGAATSRLGLGVTYSTTYYEPFHVARLFATLDLMTKGRAAWNVVTSLNNSEAANFGRTEHLAHELRYDRADEFMEVVMGLWDSWEDDALILDKAAGRFADPAKVHALNHKGTYFASKGPLPVPRSAQGHPVLIQAGQSGRGRSFAGRWGELIFVVYPNMAAGQKQYGELKAAVAASGRNPDEVSVCPACYVCVADSQSAAEEKREYIRALAKPIDAARAAFRSAELRLRQQGHGLRVHGRGAEEAVLGRVQGARRRAQRQAEPDGAGVRPLLRPRHHRRVPDLLRHAGRGGRSDGRVVHLARLRRLRPGRHPLPGRIRGLLPLRGAGVAAPRALPQGLRGSDAAGESGAAAARHRLLAEPVAAAGVLNVPRIAPDAPPGALVPILPVRCPGRPMSAHRSKQTIRGRAA